MWPFRSRLGPPPAPANRAASCGRPSNARPVGDLARARDVARIGLPDVDGGARPAQALAEVGLQVGLVAGRVVGLPRGRVEADQRRRQLDQLLAPGGNLVEDALLQRHGRR